MIIEEVDMNGNVTVVAASEVVLFDAGIDRARRCQEDLRYPCLIIARFRFTGTTNDVYYDFNSQDALEWFIDKHRDSLTLQDCTYHKARYFDGPRVRTIKNLNN